MEERTLRGAMLLGEEAMERLRASHVAVFGLGGVGSWCAEALARTGVGKLSLIDRDLVSPGNLNRQLCALQSTLGQPKAEAMAQRLRDIAPDIELRTIQGHYEAGNRDIFFSDYDYVADAIDLVSCKTDLIISCLQRGIPIISALGTGNKLDAGQLRICDISQTSGCALARVMRRELRRRGVERHTVVFSPEQPLKPRQYEAPPPGRRSVPGSLIWLPASAGLLMCQHIVTELISAP